MKIMGIGQEYIRKHTSQDNGDMESFYNSLKTDYIGVNDIETFDDAVTLMEYAFKDYKIVRTYSSIVMCSLYRLDTYRREYILLEVYKGESRGEFTNLLFTPEEMVI